MRQLRRQGWTYPLLAVWLAGCSVDAASGSAGDPSPDASQDAAAGQDTVGGIDAGTSDAVPRCEPYDPAADSDGDGLADAIEDLDRNCRVDEGETDPFRTDTDGDGISDGDEDIDRNGRHDEARGELSPLRADTDGDGVMDRDEPVAAVCTPGLVMDYLDHRFALPEGSTAFVPPGTDVELVGDDPGVVFFRPGTSDFTMLFRDVTLDVGAADVLLAVREAAQGLGGDAWFVFQSHSDTSSVHVAELAAEFPSPIPISGLLERIVGLPVPLPATVGEQDGTTTRVSVRIEAEGPHAGAIRGRLAIVVRFAAVERTPWGCGIDCIGQRVGERMVPFCEKVPVEEPNAARLLIVLEPAAVDEPAVQEMLASVERVVSDRSARGVSTDVWVASSEAHLVEGGGRNPVSRVAPGERVRDVARSLVDSGTDERPWATVLAALAAIAQEAGPGETAVLVLGLREDTEFRGGETMGRDGNSGRPPLLPGEQRDARTGYYVEAIAGYGARILAVAPFGVRLGPVEQCGSLTDASLRAGVDDALSFTEITNALHGIRMDVCFPGAPERMGSELESLLGDAPRFALSHRPIGPTLRVASREGVLPWAAYELNDGRYPGTGRLTTEVDRSDLGVAYLVWESAITP